MRSSKVFRLDQSVARFLFGFSGSGRLLVPFEMALGSGSAVAGLVLFGTCTSLFAKIGEQKRAVRLPGPKCPRSLGPREGNAYAAEGTV